jgi:hypothetical protein
MDNAMRLAIALIVVILATPACQSEDSGYLLPTSSPTPSATLTTSGRIACAHLEELIQNTDPEISSPSEFYDGLKLALMFAERDAEQNQSIIQPLRRWIDAFGSGRQLREAARETARACNEYLAKEYGRHSEGSAYYAGQQPRSY